MFSECSSLEEINLSNFNTENVSNMTTMFYRCYSLKNIFISNFNTDKAIELNSMFLGCKKELIISMRSEYNIIREEGLNNYIFKKLK